MTSEHRLPRIATIATMPSRLATFSKVVPAIRAQVDHTFVYLDGFSAVPEFLRGLDNVSVVRAEQAGDLHASSRYLCIRELSEPAIIISVDDDIIYPPDYVANLTRVLEHLQGKAVVGVHGRIFVPPHESYARHASCLAFFSGTKQPQYMHELGAGTCCFRSDMLDIDPRDWEHYNMEDINLAIEAQRRGLHRVAIARPRHWLVPYEHNQPDSLWVKLNENDTEQTKLMRMLMRMYLDDDRGSATV